MKKRMTGILLAFCLCLTLLPEAAFAAGESPAEVSQLSVSVPAAAVVAGGEFADAEPTTASGTPFFVSSSRWTRVAARGGMADADDWTAWSDSFQADSWYRLSIKLLLDYGYVYAGSVTAQISGANPEQVQVERDGNDAVYVNAWFKVGDPATVTTNIDSISISGVPTARMDRIADWADAIRAAAVSDGCRISDAYLCAWDSEENSWSTCYRDESTDDGKVYGAWLTINPLPGYAFEASVAASVNGSPAGIAAWSMDEVEIFVPFGTVTVSSVSVYSKTWPIDGNPIRNGPENFSGGSTYGGYTLESAQFQIQDNGAGEYRDLTDADTVFSWHNHYRVTAVLKAKSYAAFADTVTGSFNGASGTVCEVMDGGKTCTVTRTCAIYDPVYTFQTNDPGTHINSITIYRDDPVEGKSYADDAFSPDGESIRLSGARGTYEWHEVSCVGSSYSLKKLTKDDTFENGKVYYAPMWLRADGDNNRSFDDNFEVYFKQRNGRDINCALIKCRTDNERTKQYDIWYTVGGGTQQEITQVAVTGPEYQNGSIDISDPTAFQTDAPVTISNPYFYSYINQLSFHITARSGYYFGRTVTVTYNGKAAEASSLPFFYGDRFTAKEVLVSCSTVPAIPVTVAGITAQSRIYDGTASAELDITQAVFSGVEAGDEVTLDISGVKAAFDDKNVGTGKSVAVSGQLKLAGKDAGKYALTQPTLSLTANITACTELIDATNRNQTIYVGGSTFEAPRLTGVTVDGTPEEVNGDAAYTLNDEARTAEEIGEILKTLKAGESLTIGYTFTAKGNYKGAVKDTITVTAREYTGAFSGSQSYAVNVADTEHGSVTADRRYAGRGDTVTVCVKPDSGYVLDTLTATDGHGKELKLTDKGDGEYTFIMPSGKVEVKAAFMEDNSVLSFFYDVPNDAYCYEAVKWAAGKGVASGVGDNLFAPEAACTRAQPVTFLWRAAGSPEPKSSGGFSDVAGSNCYARAVAWAVENGITDGTGDTTFSPEATCSRAQIVTLLWRSEKSPAAGTANPFADVKSTAYYADAVLWAVKENITKGTTGTTFSPDADCTRAQIVTFLWRCRK